ncbi:phage portal protein [Pseudochrobactrum asaccharolyticum]|uniref:HK97 family phage portal protein n=1 Tax=Pseudochrobactrum asaccharolyticum TaxID=354351 RepID=A0A366DJ85_9HYPH|nr:phage portal protein [Pseudochrobactrum asaccharolyticum]RBO89298.1 HK97 family phage portal protein [Pseudochrobactrum asaccharolyticum]
MTVETAMRNTALFRAVTLIASSIGMLPLQLIHDDTKQKATDHPLYRLLHREPNSWQTAFDFRSLMQLRALVYGNAFALIIRSFDIRTGKPVIRQLVPLDPAKMEVKQNPDWSIVYNYQTQQGQHRTFKPEDIFHLRGVSLDGLNGLSLVKQARDALGLAISAELAAGRLFKNGSFIGGALKHPGKLSPEAFERLKASLAEKEGAENAGKNLILEEGMDFTGVSSSARDAQMLELRKMQVEEVARVTGVPRPLLGVDETAWGTGIEALGRFFVQYALGAWFEAWQQAVERSLLTDAEKDSLSAKYNAGALLRGSIKDQADFFAKALGAGGAAGWMTQNEARDLQDMPRVEGGDTVSKGAMMNFSGTKNGAKDDEP